MRTHPSLRSSDSRTPLAWVRRLTYAWLVLSFFLAGMRPGSSRAGEPNRRADRPDPAVRARAVLDARCAACHDARRRRPKGHFGYVLDLARMAGNPDLVVPFRPEASKLWTLVRDDDMPPPDARRSPLSSAEKEAIHDWIAAGAPAEPDSASGTLPVAAIEPGQANPSGGLLILLGKLHLLVIHFPLGLMLAAALGELWSAWRRDQCLEPAVRFCVLLGAGGAVVAAGLGWLHADVGGYGAGSPWDLGLHRWLGTGAGVCCVGVALLGEWDARRRRRSLLFRVTLFATACLVAAAGHFGGLLVHGEAFFSP